MTNVLKSKIAKAGLGLLVAAGLFAASTAGAMTQAQAQALVSGLGITGSAATALIAALTTTTTTTTTGTMTTGTGYQFNNNLSLGVTSPDVAQLQQFLDSNPATALAVAAGANGSVGNYTDYFGPATKAAVIKYQTLNNISPMAGYFGPLTRASVNAAEASSTTTTTTTGTTTTTLPAGCTTASGFSPISGVSCATGVTTTTASGPVSAALATDNPAAGNLIQGQATADLLHINFTGSGTITQMTLQRSGISDNSVFPNVYLYDNLGNRLTDAASINSMGQVIFNGLNIAVSGSMDISVRADIVSSSTGSVESTAQLTLTSYMTSGATAAITTNIAGNTFYINSGTGILATVGVGCNTDAGATGSMPSCSTGSGVNVSAGTTGYSLWSAPVSVSLHPVYLESASFEVIGSAPSNALANLGLYADGVQIATSTGINAMGFITFNLSSAPYTLPTGTTTLEVRGDIVNGADRTIQLSLQNASDLMVKDSQVGVNVSVINQGSSTATFSINQAGTINIQQGTLVVQSDPTFNSLTNVTGGASNLAIASYKLTSYGEDVKVNTVTVQPVITGSPAACSALSSGAIGLNNVTLYYNGAPVGSSQNATVSSGCTFNTLTFTPGSNLTISGGTTGTFQIHADLVNGAGTPLYTSGTITANVDITQYQGLSSGTTGSTGVLSGSNALTIQTGSLSVAQNAGYIGQTINLNTSGAELGSFTLQNNDSSEAVQVNSLNVGLYTNSSLGTQLTTSSTPIATTDFSTLTLTGLPSGSVTPIGQPTGMNTFSTNFQIPAGGSVTINVVGNVGSQAGNFVVSLQPVAVGASSRVTVTTANTAGQSMSLGTGYLAAPSLISSQSTNAQYISSGGTGATNAAQETYNFVANTGTANIIGLKFAALSGNSGTAGGNPATDFETGITLPETLTVGSNAASYAACPIATPCNFLVTTSGVFQGGTNAVVTGYYASSTSFVITSVTTYMIPGVTTATGSTPGTPQMIYQLATTGATGVALNSTGLATATASFNGGIAYLSSITGASGTGVMVPNNPSGVTLPVFVSYGPVSSTGGVASGTTSQIMLEYVQYQTGSSTTTIAPAVGSTTITLVGSKPNITLNSSTAALTNGTSVLLGTVTIAADNTGDIAISEIPLVVSLNAGTSGTPVIAGLTLTDTNGVTLANFTANGGTGTTSATGTEVFGSGTANHYRISAGSSKTFEIHANFTGSTFGTSATASVSLGSPSSFVWDDINGGVASNVSTSGTITSGLTGSALYSYPSGSVSIAN